MTDIATLYKLPFFFYLTFFFLKNEPVNINLTLLDLGLFIYSQDLD